MHSNKILKIFSSLIIIMLIMCGTIIVHASSKVDIFDKLEYLEDKNSTYTILDVISTEFSTKFNSHNSNEFKLGFSKSNWWLKVKLNNDIFDNKNNQYFLSINNPFIKRLILYIPNGEAGKLEYVSYKSGWGYRGDTQDEHFNYPIFKFPKTFDSNKYIYIHLSSPFAYNYQLKIFTNDDYTNLQRKMIAFYGGLFGALIVMLIYNFMIYVSLLDRTYLYYIVYLIAILFYQLAYLGLLNMVSGSISAFLTSRIISFGIISLVTSILFVRRFFSTKKFFHYHDIILKLLILLGLVGLVISETKMKYYGNVVANILMNITAIVVASVAVTAWIRGVRQARFFVLAWGMMIVGAIIFAAKGWGIISTNFVSTNSLIMAAVAESILISFALADRIKILRDENKKSELEAIAAQNAFLQAQIKPHFIFNALSVISSFSLRDPDKSKQLILDLSDYLRGSFDFENNNGLTTLRSELEVLKAYISIEQARFEDKLQIEYDVEDLNCSLPILSIQPLVENAIKHGLMPKIDGGKVSIIVKAIQDKLYVAVADNGIGIKECKLEKLLDAVNNERGVGIRNIHNRLVKMYGRGLIITSIEDYGTKIEFTVPYNGCTENNK